MLQTRFNGLFECIRSTHSAALRASLIRSGQVLLILWTCGSPLKLSPAGGLRLPAGKHGGYFNIISKKVKEKTGENEFFLAAEITELAEIQLKATTDGRGFRRLTLIWLHRGGFENRCLVKVTDRLPCEHQWN